MKRTTFFAAVVGVPVLMSACVGHDEPAATLGTAEQASTCLDAHEKAGGALSQSELDAVLLNWGSSC